MVYENVWNILFLQKILTHITMSFNETYEKELSFQADRRRATVEFIKIVSDLWYDKSIELLFLEIN